ncbi:hypothetical protein AVEN_35399-1 [Araneus ventricosus]|uniref:Tesmin/TSO1-like CXC domain-containing protein n=1 Tax=Araneus ventricosus TaxID=182803 RepID=A0A4Y2UBI3_ARAVE|nr:hypothetical protein AVEN_35399-1 [Araneus ventricosus]
MFCVKFQKEGFVVKQSQEDAYYLIIKSALEIEKRSQCVVGFDEDVDLLVIMTASTNSENIFFLKSGKGKAGDALYFEATLSIAPHNKGQYFVSSCVQWLRYHICSFQQGKKKFMNIMNSTELQKVVNVFRDENACPDDIDEAGQKVLILLYGGKNTDAREHSLRAYLQVQLWSGFAKSPLYWGWKETKHGLFPVTTHNEPAPPAFLSMICKCAKVCNLSCTCRKSGIKLSTNCYHCKGQGCTDSPENDNIITNSANQKAEIDIRIEEIISEVDLEEECQTLQVKKSDSKQTANKDYDSLSTSKKLKLI